MDKGKFTKYNIITYSEVDIVLEVTPGTHRVTRGPGSISPLLTVTLNTLH